MVQSPHLSLVSHPRPHQRTPIGPQQELTMPQQVVTDLPRHLQQR